MSQVMIQFRFPNRVPSRVEAAAALGLGARELDPEFGVVATDPGRDLYAVRVAPDAAGRARLAVGGDDGVGIFSDPNIGPLDPL